MCRATNAFSITFKCLNRSQCVKNMDTVKTRVSHLGHGLDYLIMRAFCMSLKKVYHVKYQHIKSTPKLNRNLDLKLLKSL